MKGIPITLEIAAVTDIGRRRASNQDNFFVNGAFIDHYKVRAERFESVDAAMTGVTVLSDFADELQSIRSYEDASFTANRVVSTANDRILKRIKKTGKPMGSTFAMLVASINCLYACNLGDSEIYLKTRFGMERLSKPQTYAQELVDSGAIAENQASRAYGRNQLSKYLGMENLRALKPNECGAELRTGDMLLICSDGVSDVLPNHSIYAMLSSGCRHADRKGAPQEQRRQYDGGHSPRAGRRQSDPAQAAARHSPWHYRRSGDHRSAYRQYSVALYNIDNLAHCILKTFSH